MCVFAFSLSPHSHPFFFHTHTHTHTQTAALSAPLDGNTPRQTGFSSVRTADNSPPVSTSSRKCVCMFLPSLTIPHSPLTRLHTHTLSLSFSHTVTGSYYKTGFVQGRAWGVAVVFGPGQTYANAAGVYNWHGGATCSYAISVAFFGVGASNYIGSGQAVFNGIPQIRTVVTTSSSGAGFYSFNGAGSLTQMYLPQYGVNMIRFVSWARCVFLCWAFHSQSTSTHTHIHTHFYTHTQTHTHTHTHRTPVWPLISSSAPGGPITSIALVSPSSW